MHIKPQCSNCNLIQAMSWSLTLSEACDKKGSPEHQTLIYAHTRGSGHVTTAKCACSLRRIAEVCLELCQCGAETAI